MKQPSDYVRVEFRPFKDFPEIALRSSDESNKAATQVVKDDLRNYYKLLSLSLPPLNEQEKEMLQQALNGWLATPDSVHLLWAEVDALTEDKNFVAYLRSLSRFELWAIVDVIQHGVWS